ncbi:MAG: hypothetical protein JWN40_2571 [Phycisphaerales bacterium]|nr:hypothetical protein [Phycisphaerales bacterium]
MHDNAQSQPNPFSAPRPRHHPSSIFHPRLLTLRPCPCHPLSSILYLRLALSATAPKKPAFHPHFHRSKPEKNPRKPAKNPHFSNPKIPQPQSPPELTISPQPHDIFPNHPPPNFPAFSIRNRQSPFASPARIEPTAHPPLSRLLGYLATWRPSSPPSSKCAKFPNEHSSLCQIPPAYPIAFCPLPFAFHCLPPTHKRYRVRETTHCTTRSQTGRRRHPPSVIRFAYLTSFSNSSSICRPNVVDRTSADSSRLYSMLR